MSQGNRKPRGGALPIVVKMMLAHNAQAGWEFECPGPEIPLPNGGHCHEPSWVHETEGRITYGSQAARGIEWPPNPIYDVRTLAGRRAYFREGGK